METQGSRIRFVRDALGLTQAQFAAALSHQARLMSGETSGEAVTRGAVANWERDKGIAQKNLLALVEMVGISIDWLARGIGPAPARETLAQLGVALLPRPARSLPMQFEATSTRTAPLFGTAAGALLGHGSFIVSNEPVDEVPMMPGLVGEPGVYALLVTGDSMFPMFPDGDLVYVSSARQPRKGDAAIIQQRTGKGANLEAFIKLFERETGDSLVTTQLNPAVPVIFPRRTVASCHRVYSRRELAGV